MHHSCGFVYSFIELNNVRVRKPMLFCAASSGVWQWRQSGCAWSNKRGIDMDTMKNLQSLLMTPVKWACLGAAATVLAGCSVVGFNAGGANVVDSAAYCGTTSQKAAVHYFATEADLAR